MINKSNNFRFSIFNYIRLGTILLLIGFFNVLSINPSFAQSDWDGTTNIEGALENTPGNVFEPNLGIYITRFIEIAMVTGAIGTLIYLIMGAIEWILSGGDKTKYESARNRMTTAVMGLGVLACIWALWVLVIYVLGINLPQLQILPHPSNTSNRSSSSSSNYQNRILYKNNMSDYYDAMDDTNNPGDSNYYPNTYNRDYDYSNDYYDTIDDINQN